MYLEKINGPADVKKLNLDELTALAGEIRGTLLDKLSAHGGHVGPNLGMVEATIALHYVFDSPKDKIVFDVSHQSYVHKMLTGRAYGFLDPTRYDDVTGYSSPAESPHDFFELGHTSTSVSLATGLAVARDLKGGAENVIAVIGDGSLSGGEAFEGLNDAAEYAGNFIVVFNDNQMSIAENHGGMYRSLAELRETGGTSDNNLFKALGFDYKYVTDGNDLESLIDAFRAVKDIDHPIVVHINTVKGKGFEPAEENKEAWHWSGPFDRATGEKPAYGGEDYSDLTGRYLLDRIEHDPRMLVVSSATPASIGFSKERREKAGRQFVDVGIAEESAVAIASGAAKGGAHVVYGTFATFLQRVYDQLSQDLSINGNHVTILPFAASAYGMNDLTHVGFYDIAEMGNIPGVRYLAPTSAEEYKAMLDWSLNLPDEKAGVRPARGEHGEWAGEGIGPVIIRVPGNGVHHSDRPVQTDYSQPLWQTVRKGSSVAIVALGDFLDLGLQAADEIARVTGVEPSVINPVYANRLDTAALDYLASSNKVIVTLEDGSLDGGFGQKVASHLGGRNVLVRNYGIRTAFYDRFTADDLLRESRLTPGQIAEDVKDMLTR